MDEVLVKNYRREVLYASLKLNASPIQFNNFIYLFQIRTCVSQETQESFTQSRSGTVDSKPDVGPKAFSNLYNPCKRVIFPPRMIQMMMLF